MNNVENVVFKYMNENRKIKKEGLAIGTFLGENNCYNYTNYFFIIEFRNNKHLDFCKRNIATKKMQFNFDTYIETIDFCNKNIITIDTDTLENLIRYYKKSNIDESKHIFFVETKNIKAFKRGIFFNAMYLKDVLSICSKNAIIYLDTLAKKLVIIDKDYRIVLAGLQLNQKVNKDVFLEYNRMLNISKIGN